MLKDKTTLIAENLGKKYLNEWIFRNFDYTFETGTPYAIIGPNGSGKSTLLQTLSGSILSSVGNIEIRHNDIKETFDTGFRQFSIASPAQELIEELTLKEAYDFHSKFKKITCTSSTEFAELIQLKGNLQKPIKYFSSGMKQRLKLGFAFFSDSPVLLLDEPTSNLDKNGTSWYLETISKLIESKLIIVSSNQPYEYEFCKNVINIVSYK